ncbi:patatin-like phospholipase family protein [Marinobacteraceae bacterium S3BR75-40.1]
MNQTEITTSGLKTSEDKPGTGKTVALVLGSGGARGYAHIGVIEVLAEQGYTIKAISGCSMGALIGGLFATGKMQNYKDWVTGLGQFDLIKLLDLSLSSPGAIRGEKIFGVLEQMIGDTRIEDLPLAYTAVATDLLAHKEIWFQEGSLLQAIRASIAIPSVFTPVLMNGRVLVDGGVIDPLPISPTVAAHADLIVAVNLAGDADPDLNPPEERGEVVEAGEAGGKADKKPAKAGKDKKAEADSAKKESQSLDDMIDPTHEADTPDSEWLNRIKHRVGQWFDVDAWRSDDSRSEEEALAKANKKGGENQVKDVAQPISLQKLGLGKFDIMNLTLETLQSSLTRYKVAGYPPDILINIPKNVCRTFDYHKAPELIYMGRQLAKQTLEEHRKRHNRANTVPMWPGE